MNEKQRQLLRELAEVARSVADDIRPLGETVHGETWCNADWLADELAALDWELAREALVAA